MSEDQITLEPHHNIFITLDFSFLVAGIEGVSLAINNLYGKENNNLHQRRAGLRDICFLVGQYQTYMLGWWF